MGTAASRQAEDAPEDAARVPELVARLDGNPGRIEKAAGRRTVRTLRELLAELSDPLPRA